MISCAYVLLFLNQIPFDPPIKHHQPGFYSSYYSSRKYNYPPDYQSKDEESNHTKLKLLEPQRLIILGDDPRNPFYGAYQLPSSRYFPKLDANLDIISTSEKDYGSGTKVMAYCSPTLSTTKIIEKLVHGQSPVTKTREIDPDSTTISEQQCWQRPKELTQDEICSSRDIISLANQGLLSVTGIYSKLAPENKGDIPIVNVKSQLALKDMVSGPQLYAAKRVSNIQKVLVWYFGHLHIFERENKDHSWWPTTKVSVENNNAAILLNFMRRDFGLFRDLDVQLQRFALLEKSAGKNQAYTSLVSLEAKNKPAQIMAEITRVEIRNSNEPNLNYLNAPFRHI
ncbi:putative effector protein [Blumeria hordei DH14]|uniref:Putative effector protein n=1 Tax=Blumeria graminis f. sp. hordei (strain DH14) TaxID=546991 RepID=N1JJW2_BLUG1|nr:putative effector protein [Blumeria hordei DH14]